MSTYQRCISELSPRLKKRGIEQPETMAQGMCLMWAEENGQEKEFGITNSTETQRKFAMDFKLDVEKIKQSTNKKSDMWEFPIKAITSGRHDYEVEGDDQKVFIEPSILKESLDSFNELPIYYTHQRTPEDLIGKAINPKIEELENGKVAVTMTAQVFEPTERTAQVIEKVKDGDITHVSIDWFSKDVDVMGDSYATNIRPVEVSFIDNEIATPVCGECTIDTECGTHTEREFAAKENCGCDGHKEDACQCTHDGEEKEVDNMSEEVVKTESEKILEREFASYKKQLEDVSSAHSELEGKYKEAIESLDTFKKAEEERQIVEATRIKKELVGNVISKELLLGRIKEDAEKVRAEELTNWEDNKLSGFYEALESMPMPETEKTFGKGIVKDSEEKAIEAEPEVNRLFSMENGRMIYKGKK
mgnify:FL=1